MRVLVTGGAGYIGSNLVDELIAAGLISEEQVLDALDAAEHAQLIRTTRGARAEEYLFTHDKIREVTV